MFMNYKKNYLLQYWFDKKKITKKSFKSFLYPMCYERVQNFSIVIIVDDQRAIYDDITLPELEARKTQNCDLGWWVKFCLDNCIINLYKSYYKMKADDCATR